MNCFHSMGKLFHIVLKLIRFYEGRMRLFVLKLPSRLNKLWLLLIILILFKLDISYITIIIIYLFNLRLFINWAEKIDERKKRLGDLYSLPVESSASQSSHCLSYA